MNMPEDVHVNQLAELLVKMEKGDPLSDDELSLGAKWLQRLGTIVQRLAPEYRLAGVHMKERGRQCEEYKDVRSQMRRRELW